MAACSRRVLWVALVCVTTPCAAADDDLFEEHHAHEHGAATLDVALDGSTLQLQFRTPAINLLGFEHEPRSPQEHSALDRAMRLLRDPASQFQPSPPARCQVVTASVTAPDWAISNEHADFAADYEFRCEQPQALRRIDVRLLNQLGSDVKVRAQVASASGQYGTDLTRANPHLSLRVQQ